jgi:hypothetical protein
MVSVDDAITLVPRGWGFEIRSYEDGTYTAELWRHNKTPLVETGSVPIREHRDRLAEVIYRAAQKAVLVHFGLNNMLTSPFVFDVKDT